MFVLDLGSLIRNCLNPGIRIHGSKSTAPRIRNTCSNAVSIQAAKITFFTGEEAELLSTNYTNKKMFSTQIKCNKIALLKCFCVYKVKAFDKLLILNVTEAK
jgi:hypothetical protein